MEHANWTEILLGLFTLASRLESEGQYNLAKLMRATADSLCRRAAYSQTVQGARSDLVEEIRRIAGSLSEMAGNEDVISAFERGAAALAGGRLPLIHEVPHPHVCRTCGHMVMGEAIALCPICSAQPETFQLFLPIYWLDAFDPHTALEKLRQTPLKVAALLEGLSERAMTRQPHDGGWAIRNIISHLRDAQGVLDFRLNLFARDEHPVLESKAVFEWATREEERPPSTLEIFENYKATRANILARLEAFPLEDWWRTGSHEEFGEVSIKQQVSYFTAHEFTHLPQIARLRDFPKEIRES